MNLLVQIISYLLSFTWSALTHKGYCMPKDLQSVPPKERAINCGEDGYFIHHDFVGVLDGVGGWSRSGIDTSFLVWKLIEYSTVYHPLELNGPQDLLEKAYDKLKSHLLSGSCTAIYLSFEKGILKSSLIGDSGFLVARKSKDTWTVVYRSTEQQHFFNAPLQIGLNMGVPLNDLPGDSVQHEMAIYPGDLVISGTDGLFDNLFDEDILKIIAKYDFNVLCEAHEKAQECAQELVETARKYGMDNRRTSPFGRNALKQGYYFEGGKLDDVAVVVSFVHQLDQCADVCPVSLLQK